jgi:hypothetical protein
MTAGGRCNCCCFFVGRAMGVQCWCVLRHRHSSSSYVSSPRLLCVRDTLPCPVDHLATLITLSTLVRSFLQQFLTVCTAAAGQLAAEG